MTTTTVDLGAIAPIERPEATELGRIAYHRFVELVAGLEPEEWRRATDCTGWTVRDLTGHLAGAMMSAASVRRLLSEQRAVRRRVKETGELEVDAMTAVQIEVVADLSEQELVARMRGLVGSAARGRARVPNIICRAVRIPVEMGSIRERWSLGYLLGPILTRDAWLHRIDVARATDRTPELDTEHDGRIVADVAREWAHRHGQPVQLALTGPAGGRFTAGRGGPELEMDAVEFCRVLSGRAEPTHELMATEVPF